MARCAKGTGQVASAVELAKQYHRRFKGFRPSGVRRRAGLRRKKSQHPEVPAKDRPPPLGSFIFSAMPPAPLPSSRPAGFLPVGDRFVEFYGSGVRFTDLSDVRKTPVKSAILARMVGSVADAQGRFLMGQPSLRGWPIHFGALWIALWVHWLRGFAFVSFAATHGVLAGLLRDSMKSPNTCTVG
jgi:hypothetical protein